jgi:hypothetical protein
MPTAFQYIRNSDGRAVQIVEMDEIICTALGWIIDEKEALGFDAIAYIGCAVLHYTGGFEVTKELFEQWLKHHMELCKTSKAQRDHVTRMQPFWQKFLYEEYTFKAWKEFKK